MGRSYRCVGDRWSRIAVWLLCAVGIGSGRMAGIDTGRSRKAFLKVTTAIVLIFSGILIAAGFTSGPSVGGGNHAR